MVNLCMCSSNVGFSDVSDPDHFDLDPGLDRISLRWGFGSCYIFITYVRKYMYFFPYLVLYILVINTSARCHSHDFRFKSSGFFAQRLLHVTVYSKRGGGKNPAKTGIKKGGKPRTGRKGKRKKGGRRQGRRQPGKRGGGGERMCKGRIFFIQIQPELQIWVFQKIMRIRILNTALSAVRADTRSSRYR